jgi:hypothetical protein
MFFSMAWRIGSQLYEEKIIYDKAINPFVVDKLSLQ